MSDKQMIESIVTDIEGTTTSISFVHEVLFPYSAKQLHEYLKTHWIHGPIQKVVAEAASFSELESPSCDEIASVFLQWIQEDQKVAPLKKLQGFIWKDGYESGELLGHMYPDVNEHLHRWHEKGLTLSIFSSGSVEAQKLLFGHLPQGDLTPLFSHFFDTAIGNKRTEEAYEEILKTLQTPAERVLFLSDVEEELDAAKASGMQTCQLVREEEGSRVVSTGRHQVCRDFHEVTQFFLLNENK